MDLITQALVDDNLLNYLIGNQTEYHEIIPLDMPDMPYMSERDIVNLSTNILDINGRPDSPSRRTKIKEVMLNAIADNKLTNFFDYLFSIRHLKEKIVVDSIPSHSEMLQKRLELESQYLEVINGFFLIFYSLKIVHRNKTFEIIDISSSFETIDSHSIRAITQPYINSLIQRCNEDLINNNFDSIITKSRTLLEETFIYVLTRESIGFKQSGKLMDYYNEVKEHLNMKANNNYDRRINDLLNGIQKVISSISDLRNINSDSHGVGEGRVEIFKREALLMINSSMIVSSYVLSVYQDSKSK